MSRNASSAAASSAPVARKSRASKAAASAVAAPVAVAPAAPAVATQPVALSRDDKALASPIRFRQLMRDRFLADQRVLFVKVRDTLTVEEAQKYIANVKTIGELFMDGYNPHLLNPKQRINGFDRLFTVLGMDADGKVKRVRFVCRVAAK